ncbi:hypothetical protein BJY59DRAFT_345629 [Rhodotorula toruloides]
MALSLVLLRLLLMVVPLASCPRAYSSPCSSLPSQTVDCRQLASFGLERDKNEIPRLARQNPLYVLPAQHKHLQASRSELKLRVCDLAKSRELSRSRSHRSRLHPLPHCYAMVGGRQRKPTARALDAAESRLLVASLSRERPRAVGGRPASPATPAPRASASTSTTKTTYSAAAAPVKKNGRAQNARGKQAIERETGIAQEQVDEEVADGTLEGSAGLGPYGGQQDLTLYCVCLGYDTGEQPMIQCEHCSNWCVRLLASSPE